MDATSINDKGTRIEILSAIAQSMEESEKANVIFSVPNTQAEFESIQKTDFMHVVWGRLYSLGYAKDESLKVRQKLGPRRAQITVEVQFSKAVKRFQKAAGSVQDGWVGLQTWESMQELFTFEQDSNLEKWFQPQYSEILYRATHLRMMMLGLAKKPSGHNRASGKYDDVQSGLKLWRHILNRLSPDLVDDSTDEHILIEWLFDIDRLTKLVSANFADLRAITAQQNIELKFKPEDSLRFQKSLLKIELWLYGVDGIQPGNRGQLQKVHYVPAEKRENKGVNILTKAVSEFLDEFDVKVPENIANDESRLIELTLKHLASLDDESLQQANSVKQSAVMNEKLGELLPAQQEQIVQSMQDSELGLGAWLFDGVKRVLRWLQKSALQLFNWVNSKAKQAKRLINKLAVGAKRLATDAYNFVKRGFQVLIDGITFLATPTYKAKGNALVIHKQSDMDMLVVIDSNAKLSDVNAFWDNIAELRLRARAAMELASLIITEAIKIIRNVAFQGPIAIVSLLISIYKMRNSEIFAVLKQAYATYK